MSGTTDGLRRKIVGAGDLGGVVRSMKALAASSIGQYDKAVQSLADYERTVELGLAACFRHAGPAPFAAGEKSTKNGPVGAIVFGSDQGLVGRFNEVLAEFATHELGRLPGKTRKIWAIGERIHALLADTGLAQAGELSVPSSINAVTPFVGRILIEIEAARERGEVAEVHLFHHRLKSGAGYEPIRQRLLPLDRLWQGRLAALPWPAKNLPEVLGGAAAALPAFVRGYLFVLLFRAGAESLAAENASRLAAMQRAEKNIDQILQEMNRAFHRIRQESIDEELFDVIAGYEARASRCYRGPPTATE